MIVAWAARHWPGGPVARPEATAMAPDGSTRFFVRLRAAGRQLVAMHGPDNPAEARAWLHLAGVLAAGGLPAPKVWAAEARAGLFLMDDLGQADLHGAALALAGDADALAALYEPVLAMLARLQAVGAAGLDVSYCFDGAELSPEFLLRREAGYFMEWFVEAACGLRERPAGLAAELTLVAERAGRAEPRGLVHRDFQSRNIVLGPCGPGLVDFQGARLGPAQYDLASLLHDPYVDLPWPLRRRLLGRYLDLRRDFGPFDAEAFVEGWPFVCLSRLMQALGAYGFLCGRRKKPFFAAHGRPALNSLRRLLAEPPLAMLPALGQLVRRLPDDPGPLLAALAGEDSR